MVLDRWAPVPAEAGVEEEEEDKEVAAGAAAGRAASLQGRAESAYVRSAGRSSRTIAACPVTA
jgi:hypothetical protein